MPWGLDLRSMIAGVVFWHAGLMVVIVILALLLTPLDVWRSRRRARRTEW